jgi:hypothetical protein
VLWGTIFVPRALCRPRFCNILEQWSEGPSGYQSKSGRCKSLKDDGAQTCMTDTNMYSEETVGCSSEWFPVVKAMLMQGMYGQLRAMSAGKGTAVLTVHVKYWQIISEIGKFPMLRGSILEDREWLLSIGSPSPMCLSGE